MIQGFKGFWIDDTTAKWKVAEARRCWTINFFGTPRDILHNTSKDLVKYIISSSDMSISSNSNYACIQSSSVVEECRKMAAIILRNLQHKQRLKLELR